MERWRGRVALVTGASSGIGPAIAYQLQDAGVTVVALARRVEKIPVAVEDARKLSQERGRVTLGKASSPGKLHALKCDISKEEDILAAFKWVKDNLKTLHILVNNAGLSGSTKLYETNTDELKSILHVNVLGLSICTREAIQLMRECSVDDGHIVHIGSRSGHVIVGIPGLSVYSASKHAVRVLTEGLRKELVAAKSRIRVTEVSPGFTQTELMDNAEKGRAQVMEKAGRSGQSQTFWDLPHLKPEDVAEAVLYAISTPPHVQEIFPSNRPWSAARATLALTARRSALAILARGVGDLSLIARHALPPFLREPARDRDSPPARFVSRRCRQPRQETRSGVVRARPPASQPAQFGCTVRLDQFAPSRRPVQSATRQSDTHQSVRHMSTGGCYRRTHGHLDLPRQAMASLGKPRQACLKLHIKETGVSCTCFPATTRLLTHVPPLIFN